MEIEMLLSRNGSGETLRSVFIDTKRVFDAAEPMSPDIGITGSTFRAYRNFSASPSVIYRKWVFSAGYSIINKHPVNDRKSFQFLHKKLLESLVGEWDAEGLRKLSFSEQHKIIDLFVKAVAFRSGHPCEKARYSLFQYGNIPLDKFSLLAMSELFYGVVVCPSPSMGHIRDKQTYDFLQDQIFMLTQSENLPNLVFDHYAWNLTHPAVGKR